MDHSVHFADRPPGRSHHRDRRSPLAVLPVLMLVLLAGCGTPKTSDRDVRFVTPSEGTSIVERRGGPLGIGRAGVGAWVDARPRDAFVAGHIPGAIHLPLEDARRRHGKVLADAGAIVVYGNDERSADAIALSKVLLELGYKNVHTLRGGLKAWEDAGNPIEQGDG